MGITLQSMSRGLWDPPNQGMEPTAEIVTPFAFAKRAPISSGLILDVMRLISAMLTLRT